MKLVFKMESKFVIFLVFVVLADMTVVHGQSQTGVSCAMALVFMKSYTWQYISGTIRMLESLVYVLCMQLYSLMSWLI